MLAGLKGEIVMTKAKGRARAKARAAAKAAKPVTKSAKPDVKVRAGHFDPKANAMRNTGGSADIRTMAAMKRGSARSR